MVAEDRKRAYAKEAFKLSLRGLRRKIPTLTAAMEIMDTVWTRQEDRSGTDGETIYWKEEEVLGLFAEGADRLQRRYLHFLLHGMYLHRFRGSRYPERIWWLACDLMTEYRIDRMHVEGFEWPIPGERSRYYRKLREEGVRFHEKNLADWLKRADQSLVQALETIFRKDEHTFWRMEEEPGADGKHRETFKKEQLRKTADAAHKWKTVFEQLELRETEHKRQAGGSAGAGSEKVILEKEKGHDYRMFLKKFAVTKEELSLDMDSFDYIPYDYSRRMYENLVFLEPLEYREVQKLSEFVIAIDTSGSCSGEIVRQFLTETWEIFQEKDNFFRDMRIHLIQCDCLIQDHVCVTCEEEWKDYLEHMEIKGHGDTDFTPVFRLVDKMVEEKELKDLKGLLYFTDGDGIYPPAKPDYETAFVFLNEELTRGKAPGWALTLTLDRELEARA